MAVRYAQVAAVGGGHTHCAATVESAVQHGHLAAVLERDHAALAVAGLLRVAGGQLGERDTVAVHELQHVGIARHGGEGRLIHARAEDAQIVGVVNLQLISVIFRGDPGVIGTVALPVIRRRGKVILALVKEDERVRRDSSEKLVDAAHTDGLGTIWRRGLRCLLRGRTGHQSAAREQYERQHSGDHASCAFLISHDLLQSFF